MAMKTLLRSLRRGNREAVDVTALLCDVTLADLGAYVSDTHASQYLRNRAFPLAQHTFRLDAALQPRQDGSDGSGVAAHVAATAMTPMLVAHTPATAAWKCARSDVIGCSTLYEDDDVCVCWFVVPPGRVLPLHDHPGMRVWQRVLVGTLHIVALDWADTTTTTTTKACGTADEANTVARALHNDRARAQRGSEAVVVFAGAVHGVSARCGVADVTHFAACSGGGTLHELSNLHPTQPALFLDVIAPPYHRPPHHIACTYFTASRHDGTPVAGLLCNDSNKADDESGGSDVCRTGGQCDECVVHVGEHVHMTPRHDYAGPPMNGYVRVTSSRD